MNQRSYSKSENDGKTLQKMKYSKDTVINKEDNFPHLGGITGKKE